VNETAGKTLSNASIFNVSSDSSTDNIVNTTQNLLSENIITYQSDLNYDGRVSMSDLAYLNAGAVKENTTGVVATDVDTNSDGEINSLDLSSFTADWDKTIHNDATLGTDSASGLLEHLDQTYALADEMKNGVRAKVNDSIHAQNPFAALSTDKTVSWVNSAFQDQNAIERVDVTGFDSGFSTIEI